MKTAAVIEARMTSSRLPGKVLMPANGIPLLEILTRRLKKVSSIDQIILATTVNQQDDILIEFAEKNKIQYFRGSEDDVLSRVIGAASKFNVENIVEITGDCPLIDPQIVDQVIRTFYANNVDYVSNVSIRSYPDGMDTQIFSLNTLKRSESFGLSQLEKEHVTLHIRNSPHIFTSINLVAPQEINWPQLGLTLDDKRDYFLICKILENFKNYEDSVSCSAIVNYLRENPKLVEINSEVIRKGNS